LKHRVHGFAIHLFEDVGKVRVQLNQVESVVDQKNSDHFVKGFW
jgi:hypothetical protein